jgi:hypothetical protein
MDYYIVRVKSKSGEVSQAAMTITQINAILNQYQYSRHCLFGLKRLHHSKFAYNNKYISAASKEDVLTAPIGKINLGDLLTNKYVDSLIKF